MPNSTQQPISKTSPKQPQPAMPRATQAEPATTAHLEHLDRVRDLDGQKARASELYGASAGHKTPVSPQKPH